jgi:hypothetical protein
MPGLACRSLLFDLRTDVMNTSSFGYVLDFTSFETRTLLLTRCETGLCRRRGWTDPMYECYRDHNGYTCLVLVNGREYQTDLAYESDVLAQENAAMRAFMVCRNFSVNGGMLARNGIVQGLPAQEPSRRRKSRHTSSRDSDRHSRRSGHHSSSSSTASFD